MTSFTDHQNKIFQMKKLLFTIIMAFTTGSISLFSQVQDIFLRQSNPSGIYKKGEKISVVALTRNHADDSLNIRILKNNIQSLIKKTIKIDGDSLLVFEGSFSEPCSIIIEAKSKTGSTSIGVIIEPGKLKPGAKRPDDFESFWEGQKKSLSALPWDVKTTAVESSQMENGYTCVNTEINCLGPKPVRGYFARPDNAKPKSLPAVILVHAAGVKGGWCRSSSKDALAYAKRGALSFDLNAHGMLNGQPDSYYDSLEKGELLNYSQQNVTSRDNFYFRGMYLRLLRTIDFMTRQPEWDGRRILVIGESQGGGQALAAAGLDKRVSAVVAIVPAMCDWLGSLSGRSGGWPRPFESNASKEEMLKSIPYYDNANILKGSKATIFTEIGLIDMTCPATSVYTAINQADGKKIIYAVPYRPHNEPKNEMTTWRAAIYNPREQFIRNYLK